MKILETKKFFDPLCMQWLIEVSVSIPSGEKIVVTFTDTESKVANVGETNYVICKKNDKKIFIEKYPHVLEFAQQEAENVYHQIIK